MKRIGVGLLLVILLAACSQQVPEASLDSQASQWKFLGDKLNTTYAYTPSMALRATDRPVVSFFDSTTNVLVKEWNGSQWLSLGSIGQTTGGTGPDIATRVRNSPGAPLYDPIGVAWDKYGGDTTQNDVYVKLRVGHTWVALGGPIDVKITDNAHEPSLVLDKLGFPIVAWFEFNPDVGYTIYVKRWVGITWVQLGGPLVSDTWPRAGLNLSIDSLGNPVIAFSGYDPVSTAYKVYVKRWNGFKWLQLGGVLGTDWASGPSVAIGSDNYPVVTWVQKNNVYASRWNGKNWVSLGTTINDATSFYAAVAVDNSNKPVVVFDENSKINVKRWTGTQWDLIGEALNKSGSHTGERLGIVVNSQDKAIVTWLESAVSTANVYVKQQK